MAPHLILRPLRGAAQRLLRQRSPAISPPTRNYISEMRKEAFEGHILRLLRNEVRFEIDRSPPSKVLYYFCFNQVVCTFFAFNFFNYEFSVKKLFCTFDHFLVPSIYLLGSFRGCFNLQFSLQSMKYHK